MSAELDCLGDSGRELVEEDDCPDLGLEVDCPLDCLMRFLDERDELPMELDCLFDSG